MGSQFSVKDAQWVHPSNFISYNKTEHYKGDSSSKTKIQNNLIIQ